MKRRLIIAGVTAAVLIAGIWFLFAWQAHRSRFDYSGTVETREIQIGSKIGGRVVYALDDLKAARQHLLQERFEHSAFSLFARAAAQLVRSLARQKQSSHRSSSRSLLPPTNRSARRDLRLARAP